MPEVRDLIARAEARAINAARQTCGAYLETVRAAVLRHDTRHVTADADPNELPPSIDAWPPRAVWDAAAGRFLIPVLVDAWRAAWRFALPGEQVTLLADDDYIRRFLADSTRRLGDTAWPDEVYEAVRTAVATSIAALETPAQLRDRLAELLALEPWEHQVELLGRNEAMAAHNVGGYQAGLARQEVFGEQLFKQWSAVDDLRTRPEHRHADGQVVEATAAFQVGGEPLLFPHDPLGSAGNTISCRCVLLWLDETEADAARVAYDTKTQEETVDSTREGLVAAVSGSTSLPSDSTMQADADPAAPTDLVAGESGPTYWTGPLLALDHPTGDSTLAPRMVGVQEAYRATNHPWLSYQRAAAPEHDGKIGIGRVEILWVAPAELDGNQVPHLWGAGTLDMADPDAQEAARKLRDGYAGTVSADLDSAESEIRWFDADGNQVDEPDEDEIWAWLEDEDIGKTPAEYVHTWRLAGATLVQDPAFHTGWVQLTDQPPAELAAGGAVWNLDTNSFTPAAVTASATSATAEPGSQLWCEQVATAAPWCPPASWFTDPHLSGLTKVTVTDQGRVYGHLADWNTLHEVYRIPPPHCPYGGTYPKFHRHPVNTDDGQVVLTGPLASNGHADTCPELTLAGAQMHYDDPNYVIADVTVGEDEHGIWAAGALRPGVSPFQVMLAYRYSFSGDWRDQALIAACAVSTPAFHVAHDESVVALAASAGAGRPKLAAPRTRMRRHVDGSLAVLVASGIVTPRFTRRNSPSTSDVDGFALFRQFRAAERTDRRLAAAHRRVTTNPERVGAAARRVLRGETA